MELATASSREG